jgi:outer membrane protein assembly factor BamB
VSIVAECPHCETRFTLQDDLVGRSMRCPNLDCREIFEVRPKYPGAAPPAPAKPEEPNDLVLSLDGNTPPTAVGAVEDMLPVVDAVLASPPPPPPKPQPARRTPRPKPKPTEKPEPEVIDAVVVAPPVREVVWSADKEEPAAAPPRGGRVKAEPVEDDEPILRRRKRSNRGPLILVILSIMTVLAAGAGALYLFQFQQKKEERLAEQAKEQYGKAEWATAAKSYEQLAADYPDSERTEEYRFFADLASMQAVVRSVTIVENPRPAVERLKSFVAARRDSPFARPKEYGHDIIDAGKKLGEDIGKYAEGRVQAFAADRSKPAELKSAEEMVAEGRGLPALLEPFRAKEDSPFVEISKKLDEVEAGIRGERRRLDVMARVRARLAEATAVAIEEAKDDLRRSGYADDAEALGLIQAAEANFLAQVRYEPDPAGPQPPSPSEAASLLFVSPIGETKVANRGQLDEPPVVFLAVARGVLYALDEDHGNLIWTLRLGPDVYDPPPVVRIAFPEGAIDLAVAASNITGTPVLSGIEVNTGRIRWQQRLEAPAVGPAAIVGTRAFVPLRDSVGTVAVVDLTSGTRMGRIVIGQPVGQIAVRPGTDHLYIAAESRRVFVFDAAADPSEGSRPWCLRVIPTDHPAGTLRNPPLVLGPVSDDAGTRLLVICQADGPTAMKLRAFPLPLTPGASPGAPPVIEAIAAAHEFMVPGWTQFPVASDGERLVLVTDAGQFRLFGINQPGNNDRALFTIPHPDLPHPPDQKPAPGLVIPAEEGTYWVLAGGTLQKFRRSVLFDRGLSVVGVEGTAAAIGEPTQPAQFNAGRDTAFLVVRSPNSAGCRALAIDVGNGQVRWERQLGMVPAAPPVATAGGLVLLDVDGGAVTAPREALAKLQGESQASMEWMTAGPLKGGIKPSVAMRSADGKTLFTVTPVSSPDGDRWVIRRFEHGRLERTGSVKAPSGIAGSPAVMNGELLIPAADGLVYRIRLGGRGRPVGLARGPQWADRGITDPKAFVVVLSDEEFATSDGGRVLSKWVWPKDGDWSSGSERWQVRERIAVPPVSLAAAGGQQPSLLVADVTGAVWLFPADRGGPAARQWVPGRTVSIPAGTIADSLVTRTDANGDRLAIYAVDGKRVVCLDLDRSEPKWVVVLGDDAGRTLVGTPQAIGKDWLVTDLAGRVTVLNGETGETVTSREVALPGVVPAEPALAIDESRVLVPLSDGSAVVLPFPAAAPQPRAKP